MPGRVSRPRPDVTCTINPSPRTRMPGRTARATCSAPNRLVRNTASTAFAETSIGAGTPIPALETSASMRPCRSVASSTPRAMEAGSSTSMSGTDRSQPSASARSSSASRSSALAPSVRRMEAATAWPRAASRSAVSRPKPDEQPVTSTARRSPDGVGDGDGSAGASCAAATPVATSAAAPASTSRRRIRPPPASVRPAPRSAPGRAGRRGRGSVPWE